MSIERLVAAEAIRNLAARYAHAADRGRFDDVTALFTDEATLELPDGRRFVGRQAIRDFFGETGRTMRVAETNAFIRHHVTSHQIDVDGEGATGYAYFFVVTDRGPDHWGRYADRYVRVGDEWRFGQRRVHVDGRAPGSRAAERGAS